MNPLKRTFLIIKPVDNIQTALRSESTSYYRKVFFHSECFTVVGNTFCYACDRNPNLQGSDFKVHLTSYVVAVVVAQLVERSLPILEVRGSNPVIGKNLYIYQLGLRGVARDDLNEVLKIVLKLKI